MRIKNVGIQGLRGMACLMVFLSHWIGALPGGLVVAGYDLQRTPLKLLWGGQSAVIIFFIISGYFFYRKSDNNTTTLNGYFMTIVCRIERIYPLFFLSLVIGILGKMLCPPFDGAKMSAWIAAFWEKPIPVFEFLKTLCLIVPFDSDLINPPIWTLSVEITILFFLPFIKRCIQKYSSFMVWIMCVLLTAIGPLKYLPTFVLGCAFAKNLKVFQSKNAQWLSGWLLSAFQ